MVDYDVIVVGGGAAGLTSAIYTVRAGLTTLLVEKELFGGQIALTEGIENYPGFESIQGKDLVDKMLAQAKKQGVQIKVGEVQSITTKGKNKVVVIDGKKVSTLVVVLAVGSAPRKLDVLGRKEFDGKGVHYCVMCDGPLYKGKTCAIIGGGDAAIKESLSLAKIAKKVFVIHRRETLRAEKLWQDKARATKNIEFIWNSEVRGFFGEKFLDCIKIVNVKTNKESKLDVSAVFTYIGHIPNTKAFDFKKDARGYFVVDKEYQTSEDGVFAAGDCVSGNRAQIATSVGTGAAAGMSVINYLHSLA
jgi:thioredoxin reductase (NADPH)